MLLEAVQRLQGNPDAPLMVTTGRFFVALPGGGMAAISEIPVPAGVAAQRMYKVDGGGLLIENANGLQWSTDPGQETTLEDTGS
ncbi:hypothetical protein [Nocardia sp. NPDC005366]|uniref:hypothetical protein n=1 Tax=Nocardia sp. NPDC005366 TaxID=3156878 RepID=UPI0033A8C987